MLWTNDERVPAKTAVTGFKKNVQAAEKTLPHVATGVIYFTMREKLD